ncbi:MAG TPA: HD domain-containing protein [Candidatus Saccharimonadales bacterium]|nr:HD domain-containing protein [Candidatus Saccharimonadales bacterium]
MQDITELLLFIKRAEKLKTELRHSWLSDTGRQESVAEHSWMLSLIAMVIFDSIDIEIDQLKVLKMLVIHDLAEAVIGDIPSFEVSERKDNKYENELKAMKEITAGLPAKAATEMLALWQEMEDKQTPEAMLAQCIDKVEVLIQHIIADIETWDEGDFGLGPYNKDELFDFNPYMRALKDRVNELFWQKMEENNTLSHIKPEHIARRHVSKA